MPYFLAGALAAIALILAPGITFSFDIVPKLIVLLTAAAFAAFPLRRSRFLYLTILTVASVALSTALSTNPSLSFLGSGWRRYGALAQIAVLLLAWGVYGQARSIHIFLRMVAAAGLVTALYGIAQYFGWDPFIPASAYHIGEGVWTIVRPPSTLGYASYFATWLLFVIFWSLALPDPIARLTGVLSVVALLLTGTRAAVVGLVAGAVVWCLWRGVRLSRKVVVAAAAVVAAGVLFYFLPPGQMMRSRMRWFQEDPWGGARPLLWRDSLRAGLSRPLAGFGPETFTATFPHYESKELARAYPDFAHESPHNIFLDALVSQGAPGVLLLFAWCAIGFGAAWHCRTKHPMLSASLAAALAAGLVSQQFTVFILPTAAIFFATVALAEGLRAESEPPRRYIPLAVPLLYFAVRAALDDHALLLTQRDLASNNLAGAAANYARSHNADDLWYSRTLTAVAGNAPTINLRLEAMLRATTAGEKATRTAEAPFNAWFSLSALRAGQNDLPGAERCLRSAINAHPNWFKPHWILAQILHAAGRDEDARGEARTAIDLDGGKHPEVERTLHRINLP